MTIFSFPSTGNFLSITRNWSTKDKLTLQLPLVIRTEPVQGSLSLSLSLHLSLAPSLSLSLPNALKVNSIFSDDRPEYSSIQAILFGPYLLAGLTKTDRRLNFTSPGTWITAVPSSHHSQLVSFTQSFPDGSQLLLSTSNGSIAMLDLLPDGSDSAVHATFRLAETLPGKTVALEPFDLPGMAVAAPPDPAGGPLLVSAGAAAADYTFKLVAGLDGKEGSVSLELVSRPGCYVAGATEFSVGNIVRLACAAGGGISPAAVSFQLGAPMRNHSPISFVAKGEGRNFLLEPLMSLKDESYTVYFDMDG